jgi:hypothetical protein
MLDSVADVNHFQYVDVLQFTEGDLPTIFFQLIDAAMDRAEKGFVPGGRRYVPAAGTTLTVTLQSIDSAKTITRVATQPFPNDTSIWAVALTTGDSIVGFRDMKLTLVEPLSTKYGFVRHAVSVQTQKSGV